MRNEETICGMVYSARVEHSYCIPEEAVEHAGCMRVARMAEP